MTRNDIFSAKFKSGLQHQSGHLTTSMQWPQLCPGRVNSLSSQSPARNRFCPQSLEHVALPDSICTIVLVCILCILCIYVSMYLCIYVSMYLCIYASMYVCMYVCTYECLFVCLILLVCHACLSVRPCARSPARREGGREGAEGGTYIAMFVNTYRIQMHAISQSVRKKRQKTFFPTRKHRRFLTCLIEETGCLPRGVDVKTIRKV